MGRFRLARDPGRKLLALLLALFVWWLANDRIEETRTREFRLEAASAERDANDNALTILVPDDWIQVDPSPSSARTVSFVGPRRELATLFATPVRAVYRPRSHPDRESNTYPVGPVKLSDFEWSPPAARDYLDSVKTNLPLGFSFERRIVEPSTELTVEDLSLSGEPAPGFQLAEEGVAIEPNRVELSGPASAVQSLLADGRSPLAPVTLGPDTKKSHVISVGLSPEHLENGLVMRPERVQVRLTVVRTGDRIRVPMLPLLVGEAPGGGDWVIPDEKHGLEWIVELMEPSQDLPSISEEWVRAHFRLIAPLEALPADAHATHNLRVSPVLIDLPPERAEATRRAIRMRPLVEGDWWIEVTPPLPPIPDS